MIFKKIKQAINDIKIRDQKLERQLIELEDQNRKLLDHIVELEWAHKYENVIKDKEWLRTLSISPGSMAGNYSFFYILVRLLSDFKPKNILEFGLGETSKLVSTFLTNELKSSNHTIIEQDKNWIEYFNSRFKLDANSNLFYIPIEKTVIKNKVVNSYADLKNKLTGVYDLYIVDGPFGSENFSRYDICNMAENLTAENEFMMIIDDYQRYGEKETVTDLIDLLVAKKIKTFTRIFIGSKSQIIISTAKYRFATLI